jgi:hypothetical protein
LETTRFRIEEDRTPVQVGDTPIAVVTYETGAPGLTYFSMHDDENTAVAATMGALRRRGGRLVEVRHTGERNLTFELNGNAYAFDPNRIFSDAGAEATLRDQGAFSEAALEAARAFSGCLLEEVGFQMLREQGGPIVTVHNNKVGSYSAESYGRGGEHEREAERMRAKRETAPDDFFFVTEPRHYRLLQGGPFHVVLQDNAAMTDDGSLSVHAAQKGLPYINVEARRGHLREQIDMLAYLNERLAEEGERVRK